MIPQYRSTNLSAKEAPLTPPKQKLEELTQLKQQVAAQKKEITKLQQKLVDKETKNLSLNLRIKALEKDRKQNRPQFNFSMNLSERPKDEEPKT